MDSQLNEQIYEEWKTGVLNSLYHFDKYILGYDAQVRPEKVGLEDATHLDMCRFIEGKYSEDGELKPFKLCEMPRGSLKSSAITVGYAIQRIIKNGDVRILITNEVYENAKKFLDEIKSHFESNQILIEIYGDMVDSRRWTKEEITVSTRHTVYKEPTVSIGSLGVLKVGMHYDVILIDDWVSENNIGTKDMMEYVIKQYKLALSLLQPDGIIVVIGTRWHFNDLYNFLENNEKHRFNVFKRGAYNPDGSLFFPQKLDEKFLNDQRLSQGSFVFSCQYLNDPIDEETAHFKKSWIRHYHVTDYGFFKPSEKPDVTNIMAKAEDEKFYKLDNMNVTMCIDPSSGVSKDYTGITVTAIDPKNRVFVLEAFRRKLTPPALLNLIFEYNEKYRDLQIGIEYAAMQVTLKYMIHDEMERRGKTFYIRPFETTYTKSKENRIKSLTYRFEFGTIFLLPEHEDLVDEILRFPVGNFDDILDSLVYHPELWSVPGEDKKDETVYMSCDWVKKQIEESKNMPFYIGQHKIDDWGFYDDKN